MAREPEKSSPGTRRSFLAVLLSVGLLTLAGPVGGPYQTASAQAQSKLSAPEAQKRLSTGDLLLIDVRSLEEWKKTGIAQGAAAITIHDPDGIRAFVDKVVRAADGRRDRPIAFICATGVRSAYAQKLMSDAGYTELYNVSEGMMGNPRYGPGWLKRGLPVQACDAC